MNAKLLENLVISYKDLFWPSFVEHDGCVLLAVKESIYQQWFECMHGDKQQIEKMMNHRHITDLLPESIEQPTSELLITFGKILRELWTAKLQRDFPTRKFEVSFPTENVSDLLGYEITFFRDECKR